MADPAVAAPGAPGVGPSAAKGGDTQEIVVTAQKTSTLASKTPVSLSVFSGAQLTQQGVVSISDLQNLAPSLSVQSVGRSVDVQVRGVTTTDFTSKGQPAISFNIDGVPVAYAQEIGQAFFDLDRVEVLRGPQGTLYGKSSTAGAINVITAKPRNEFQAYASAELGNFNTRRGDAMVNIPVAEDFAVRAAVNYNFHDGFLNQTLGNSQRLSPPALGGQDNVTGRVSGLWTIGSAADIRITGTVGHIGGTSAGNDAVFARVHAGTGASAREVYYNPMSSGLDDHFANVNAEANLTLGVVHLTYDGGYFKFRGADNWGPGTGDPAYLGYYTWQNAIAKDVTNAQEVRASNANPGRVEWVLGANYSHERDNEQDENWDTLTSCAPSLAPSCTLPDPNIVGVTTHRSAGLFGQAGYHLSDALKFTAGVRYSSDSIRRDASLAAGPAPDGGWRQADGSPCMAPNACVGIGTIPDAGHEKASKVTYRIGVDYTFAPRQLLYASISTGYKAGGFNDVDPSTAGRGTGAYGPESLTAYELGYKGRIIDTIQLSSAFYYYDYSKYQFTANTFLTPAFSGGPAVFLIYTTLVPATFYGWESEANWAPTRNDTLTINFDLERGYYRGGRVGFIYGNQFDWSGKSVDRLPRVSGMVSYEHRWRLASGGTISGRIHSKISDGYYVSDLAGNGNAFSGVYTVLPQQYRQHGFTRTDLSIGYSTPSGKVTLEGYVRNVENKLQFLSSPINTVPAGSTTPDATTVRVSDPRTYGVRMNVSF